jgi:hypothetical protein
MLEMDMQHGNGYASWKWNAARTWTSIMDMGMDMQHGQGHVRYADGHTAWTWTYTINMGTHRRHGDGQAPWMPESQEKV